MKMEWLVRVMSPMRRVWIRIAARIRMRKSGLGQLRNEVSTCEYEDVHVMWEILSLRKTEAGIRRYQPVTKRRAALQKRRHAWSVYEWAGRGRGALCCTF